jgi:hypothetical protein
VTHALLGCLTCHISALVKTQQHAISAFVKTQQHAISAFVKTKSVKTNTVSLMVSENKYGFCFCIASET